MKSRKDWLLHYASVLVNEMNTLGLDSSAFRQELVDKIYDHSCFQESFPCEDEVERMEARWKERVDGIISDPHAMFVYLITRSDDNPKSRTEELLDVIRDKAVSMTEEPPKETVAKVDLRKKWVKLHYVNDWGSWRLFPIGVEPKCDGIDIDADEGEVLWIRWPSRRTEIVSIYHHDCVKHVNDMGHESTVCSQQLRFKTYLRKKVTTCRLDEVEVMQSWVDEHFK